MTKDTKQSSSAQTKAEQNKISSTALSLQQLNKDKEKFKEAEKKESAAEAAKSRCKTCFKEISPKRLCSGHGGSTGRGGSDGASDEASEKHENLHEGGILTKPRQQIAAGAQWAGEYGATTLHQTRFDQELIEELIANGLLLVESNREELTLTIKLLCNPEELTEEQSEALEHFMNSIIEEFNQFQAENQLSDECIQILKDEKGNTLSLRITMPTLALYDAFIQQLATNLIPKPSPKAQEEDKNQSAAASPFSMEPKPSSKEEDVEENNNEEQPIFNPSPFNMNPW